MLPVTYFSRWQHETQSYAPATKTRGSFVTLVLSSKCLPLQLSYNWHRPLISQKYGKTLDSKFFYDGQGVRHFSLYSCVIFYHYVNCYQWNFKIPKQFSNIASLVSCMLWCIVSCIVSWHLYRDMYRLLRKCIVATLEIWWPIWETGRWAMYPGDSWIAWERWYYPIHTKT